MKNGKNVTPIFEANMDAALRSHYQRTGADAIDPGAMPFDRIMTFEKALEAEDDGIEGAENGPGEYEMRLMVTGVRAFLRFIKRRGVTMPQIMREIFAAGRAVQDPFFSSLTMTESGLMFSETKAAHSWRVGVLSGQIQLEGMKGYRLPGQKNPESKAVYAATAKRTCNRRAGNKQTSFLRRLKTNPPSRKAATARPGGKPKQQTFTRQLNKKSGTNEASVQPKATPTTSGQRISGGAAPTRENGGGVAGASRVTGAIAHAHGCPSGGGLMGRVA